MPSAAKEIDTLFVETRLIEEASRAAEQKELYEGYTALGSDPELCDVEFAFAAQAEAALRD